MMAVTECAIDWDLVRIEDDLGGDFTDDSNLMIIFHFLRFQEVT
jgi:hypothetical protein